MRFDDRVILLLEKRVGGVLGDDIVSEEEFIVPCVRTSLTHNEKMGYFGSYNISGFKLHLDGVYHGFTNIRYRGEKRIVKAKIHHDYSTVLIV